MLKQMWTKQNINVQAYSYNAFSSLCPNSVITFAGIDTDKLGHREPNTKRLRGNSD